MLLHIFMSGYSAVVAGLFVIAFFWPPALFAAVIGSAYVLLWLSDGWRPWVIK